MVVPRTELRARVGDLEVCHEVRHDVRQVVLREVLREDQQKGHHGSPFAGDGHEEALEGQGAWAYSCVAGARYTFLEGQIAEAETLLEVEGRCNKLNETLAGRAGPGVQSGHSSSLAESWTEDGRRSFAGAG